MYDINCIMSELNGTEISLMGFEKSPCSYHDNYIHVCMYYI